MPRPHRKKFVRGDTRDPLKLTSRDDALLRDIAEYRFLNTEQLVALHEGSARNIANRLGSLFRHGYIDRPKVQKSARLSPPHLVYSLDRKGADYLFGKPEEREWILRRVGEIKKSLPLIAHALMISQFRVCLTLALKNRTDIKLIRWIQGNDLRTALKTRGQHPSLVADAYFVLDTPTRQYPCFLETDRATMTEARYVSKLKNYWRHNREKLFKESLGIEHFRVLTVTPNEGRAKNLCLASKEANDTRTGSWVFIFASETRFNLKNPDELLGPMWQCPKDDLPHSIVE
jgi:hypothetical protein